MLYIPLSFETDFFCLNANLKVLIYGTGGYQQFEAIAMANNHNWPTISFFVQFFLLVSNYLISNFLGSFSYGRDLAILSKCNHSIVDYGTFGLWAALLAGGRIVVPTGFFLLLKTYNLSFNQMIIFSSSGPKLFFRGCPTIFAPSELGL